jgi:hypothetical protein
MEAIPTLPVHERERSNLQSHTYQSATDFSKQDALIVKRIEPQSRSNRTASKGGKHEIWPGPNRATEGGGSSRRRSCWTNGDSGWRGGGNGLPSETLLLRRIPPATAAIN